MRRAICVRMVCMKRRRIERRDGVERFAVHDFRIRRRGIVGEVGTGHDERPFSLQDLGQGGAEAGAETDVRHADDRRDDFCLGEEDLDEGDLDLDGMLADVRGLVRLAVRAGGDERRDDLPVHRGGPQGGPKTGARVEGDLPEVGRRVVRSEDDDHLIGPARGPGCSRRRRSGRSRCNRHGGRRWRAAFAPARGSGVLHEFFDGGVSGRPPIPGRTFRPRRGDGSRLPPFPPGRPRRARG